MFLVLKHYVATEAKLNARKVTTSELLSIRKTTILEGISNIFCGFVQQFGNQRDKEVGSRDRFEWI